MKLSLEYKQKVKQALLDNRDNFGGNDGQYAKKYGISGSIYSRLAGGEIEKLISDSLWIQRGRELEVDTRKSNWKIVRTKVYTEIEDSINF